MCISVECCQDESGWIGVSVPLENYITKKYFPCFLMYDEPGGGLGIFSIYLHLRILLPCHCWPSTVCVPLANVNIN